MMVTVNDNAELIVPRSIRREAGIKPGDRVEFRVADGVIRIVPEAAPPDEYLPSQRQAIELELADAQQGAFHGPFDSAEDMISHLQARIKRPGRAG